MAECRKKSGQDPFGSCPQCLEFKSLGLHGPDFSCAQSASRCRQPVGYSIHLHASRSVWPIRVWPIRLARLGFSSVASANLPCLALDHRAASSGREPACSVFSLDLGASRTILRHFPNQMVIHEAERDWQSFVARKGRTISELRSILLHQRHETLPIRFAPCEITN